MSKSSFQFTITASDPQTNARTGLIQTANGTIRTPGFVAVGTAATVKSLTPEEIKSADIDVFFVNTYHMLFRPGTKIVKNAGGLHRFMNWTGPIMTDSGGFQAFSLGDHGPRQNPVHTDNLVRISDNGIRFKSVWDGSTMQLGPRESIRAQQDLGSDIMMAFDECTFYPITKDYAKEAMKRTHRWALLCLNETKKKKSFQSIYGIVQGSVFRDLRITSARFMADQPFEGYAIGSVANSKEPRKKVFDVLDWTMPILKSTNKPIHFLGIGEIEDIFLSVERGVDTLDCITPTRNARMGWIFDQTMGLKNKFRYDITKSQYRTDQKPLEVGCKCYTCMNYTRSYLCHLFRNRELLAYRLASLHNLTFYGSLFSKIRQSIPEKNFLVLKKQWIG